jgi:Zn-dependent protease
MHWRGVPIVLSWTVFLALPYFYFRHGGLASMAIAFVSFFFLLLVHELGHAAVARWRGVPVIEIQLYVMHGLCRYEEPERESDAIWIAWGGVAAQTVLLLLTIGVSELLQRLSFLLYLDARPAFQILIVANLIIIMINLVPVPPLDGATAWRAVPKLWARVPKPSVERWWRNRKLERQSKVVAAGIIERLKKRP